jgi:L-2-hydroxyglutarate oxidase LhgO
MDEVRVTVIGAGVVGLAVAAALSRCGDDILVLDRHETFGQETSSRSSEVIHAGIYYAPGSLKALLCVRGRELLFERCAVRGIPARTVGKLIVAAAGEEGRLRELLANGEANGVGGLELLDGPDAVRLEPAVRAAAALNSPRTGILDSHALMKSLHDEAVTGGVIFSFGSEVDHLDRAGGRWEIGVGGDDYRVASRVVVKAAGLAADRVAALAGIDTDAAGYKLRWCKGTWFSYAGCSPVARLVYPVPHADLAGLGVHATLDLAGRLRFGPDTEFVDELDYRVDEGRRDAFFAGADTIIRGLDRDSFMPDMAGIRPKLAGEGVRDFVIRHEADRGLPGLINLVGIESPGLTACLAIAERVRDLAAECLG